MVEISLYCELQEKYCGCVQYRDGELGFLLENFLFYSSKYKIFSSEIFTIASECSYVCAHLVSDF
jgi:hypothetical protein